MTFGSSFQILDAASTRAPARPFLHLEDGTSISYGEFRDAVDRFAFYLHHEHGVKSADRIAVHLGNTFGFCLAAFAILRLGGVVVPFNVKLRAAELQALIDGSSPRLIVTGGRSHTGELQRITTHEPVVDIDGWLDSDQSIRDECTLPAFNGESSRHDPAFIMYTSGTTGSPKGVIVTHANVLRACETYRDGFGLSRDDVSVIAVPIFHGTGLFGQLFPLVFVGGEVVLQERYDTDALLRLIESHRATHFIGVPTMHTYLLRQEDASARLASLRKVGSGGAPLPVSVAEALLDRLRGAALFNTYGLTETTSPATMLCSRDFARKLGSIGTATPGMRARIVDVGTQQDCPPGETGELLLAGELVTPGYWNNPDATGSAFSDEWLRTGDLALIDDDGYIFLRGRMKDMISRGGEKIYPAEVEEVLLQHDDVTEAIVYGVADPLYGEVVKAQVVPTHADRFDNAELAAWCARRLAKFKVPAEIERVESIPKNASGKPVKPRTILPG